MSAVASYGLAFKFRQMAERLETEIAGKRASRRENTPKQCREAASQRIEADHLERTQRALTLLADAHDRGDIPPTLAEIRSKKDVYDMLRTRLVSHGYYHIGDTGEFANTTETARALQSFVSQRVDSAAREAHEQRRKIEELERSVKFSDIAGFFPTPPAIIEQMLHLANISPTHTVLEPSAGKGDIADAIRRVGATVLVAEVHYSLREILQAKGHKFYGTNFLECSPLTDGFDRIVQNPPFESGQDADHIMHAYACLKPGGRLVSLMSPGPFFRQDKKSLTFRDWFAEVRGTDTDLPADSFKSAFRSTGVAVKLIVIDKPS